MSHFRQFLLLAHLRTARARGIGSGLDFERLRESRHGDQEKSKKRKSRKLFHI
jgi:hypothetical protein